MYNIEQIIERYKNVVTLGSVTGFLAWGGKSYYKINDDREYQLNTTFNGFIFNGEGLVEVFEFNDGEPDYLYFSDEGRTNQITEEEWIKLSDEYDDITDFMVRNPKKTILSYHKLSDFYPHPYFPDKELLGFKCIRIQPMFELNKMYNLEKDLTISSESCSDAYFTIEDCYIYSEFWKPIYKN